MVLAVPLAIRGELMEAIPVQGSRRMGEWMGIG